MHSGVAQGFRTSITDKCDGCLHLIKFIFTRVVLWFIA
uniref:Uncharacterized protein n=1 Tax=Arundo donax TaxID=35708 RepID=A0A0A9F710_ARUDO